MTNDEYAIALDQHLSDLKRIREAASGLAKEMIGTILIDFDLFYSSVLNRSLSLLDGFIEMLKTRNLACAGILLRTQLDNCMRLYASFIAADKNEFLKRFMEGDRIDDLKDVKGNLMRDYYLHTSLTRFDERISEVYKRASGYVHLSGVAFHLSLQSAKDNRIEFAIGLPLKEEANKYLIEVAQAFFHYMRLLYFLLSKVVESKERVEKADQELNPDS